MSREDACTDKGCPPTTTSASVDADRSAVLSRRVRLLVAATITYNVIEAIVAIAAGTVASSTALIGFGLDSVIEVASATAVAWQVSGKDQVWKMVNSRSWRRGFAVCGGESSRVAVRMRWGCSGR